MSTGAGGNDEPAEISTTAPAGPASWDPPATAAAAAFDTAADKAARDAEFSLFYTDDMPRLTGYLIVLGAPPSLAADVAQEAMIAAYREWDVIDFPKAWVRRVVGRRWWKLARYDRELPVEDLPESSGLLTDPAGEEIANRHAFLGLLRELTQQQRTILALTYDDFRPTEIAGLLGMDPGTVRSSLRDARTKLKGTVQPREDTP